MSKRGVIASRQPLLGWIANDGWCVFMECKMVDALRLSTLRLYSGLACCILKPPTQFTRIDKYADLGRRRRVSEGHQGNPVSCGGAAAYPVDAGSEQVAVLPAFAGHPGDTGAGGFRCGG